MYNLQLPVNTLSFGFCSLNILRELYSRGKSANVFLVQEPPDLGAYNFQEDFLFWLSNSCANSRAKYKVGDPSFRLWHINGSENSIGEQVLFTFHETDTLTKSEINILQNQKSVLVSSKYTKSVFEQHGVKNVVYCPLGFDSNHFKPLNFRKPPGLITFSLFGKWEHRKHTAKVIQSWVKKYGGNNSVVLNIHTYNPFASPEQNQQVLMAALNGNRPPNVNPIPFVKTLKELNEGINAADIVIDMSGGEGFSLPSFTALCLGKHGVIHNCSAMKDWAAEGGAVLVESKGKTPVYDNVFFRPGQQFNQGNIFSFDEDAFLAGCDAAIAKFRENSVNEAGAKLPEKFSWKACVDTIEGQLQ